MSYSDVLRFSRVNKIRSALLLLLLIIMLGTSGYFIIEKYSLLDSLYMTIITVAPEWVFRKYTHYLTAAKYSLSF